MAPSNQPPQLQIAHYQIRACIFHAAYSALFDMSLNHIPPDDTLSHQHRAPQTSLAASVQGLGSGAYQGGRVQRLRVFQSNMGAQKKPLCSFPFQSSPFHGKGPFHRVGPKQPGLTSDLGVVVRCGPWTAAKGALLALQLPGFRSNVRLRHSGIETNRTP